MNGSFYEQLGGMASVFEQWGPCEKTVVACALARRVPWPGLKLVQRAVEAALSGHIEDEILERDANDETIVSSLLTALTEDEDDEAGGDRLRQLLTLLPHLRTDNERTKDLYVSATPALVQRCVDATRAMRPDLCRQLISYLLVHPALTTQDHRTLTQWLRYLENHMSGNRNTETVWQQRIDPCLLPDTNIWAASNNTFRRTIGKNVEFRTLTDTDGFNPDILQESFSKNGRDVDISLEGEKLNFDAAISQPKSHRSNSLTPPSNFMSSSAENLSDEPFQKPRSFSLSSEHSLSQIRPISIMYGTTGSETRLDDLRSNNFAEHPGMSMVPQWLKSLRLHKYVWLFTNISYEQMLAIDEAYLEKLGVTKGARHKLLLSIKKLHEREATVCQLCTEFNPNVTAANLGRALEMLRGVLITPIPPDTILPRRILDALELASKCLNSSLRVPARHPAPGSGDEDAPVDPLSLHCWLVEKALHHEAFHHKELSSALRRLRHRLPPGQFFHHVGDMPLQRRNLKPRWRVGPQHYHRRPAPPPPRPKSNSYPPFPPAAVIRPPPPLTDDYSSLDALCLQMTEQAIN